MDRFTRLSVDASVMGNVVPIAILTRVTLVFFFSRQHAQCGQQPDEPRGRQGICLLHLHVAGSQDFDRERHQVREISNRVYATCGLFFILECSGFLVSRIFPPRGFLYLIIGLVCICECVYFFVDVSLCAGWGVRIAT